MMGAKTRWDLNGAMLWGYFFADPKEKSCNRLPGILPSPVTGWHRPRCGRSSPTGRGGSPSRPKLWIGRTRVRTNGIARKSRDGSEIRPYQSGWMRLAASLPSTNLVRRCVRVGYDAAPGAAGIIPVWRA